jgi:hypothetical protein
VRVAEPALRRRVRGLRCVHQRRSLLDAGDGARSLRHGGSPLRRVRPRLGLRSRGRMSRRALPDALPGRGMERDVPNVGPLLRGRLSRWFLRAMRRRPAQRLRRLDCGGALVRPRGNVPRLPAQQRLRGADTPLRDVLRALRRVPARAGLQRVDARVRSHCQSMRSPRVSFKGPRATNRRRCGSRC